MSSGRRNQLTGQIAEHLVCAELGRRDLIATSFAGNVPTFDVLATDVSCRTVPIQVKATNSDNWPSDARAWMNIELDPATKQQHLRGARSLETPDLVYVCVAVAPPRGDQSDLHRDRFFILKEANLQQVCIAGYSAWMETKNWRRPRNPASFDCRYTIQQLAAFEDRWDVITKQLAEARPSAALEGRKDLTTVAPA